VTATHRPSFGPRVAASFVSVALAIGVLVPLAAPSPTRAASPDLFFSEYVEGSSDNKALEIHNGTGAAISLATAGYRVQMHFNGAAGAGLTIPLTGTVANGDVFVLAHENAAPAVLAQADQVAGGGWFNGDDAVVLRRGAATIDVIGKLGSDPSAQWGSGLASTADNTIRRKASVACGDPNGVDAFEPAIEWDGFASNTFAGLGTHTVAADATCARPAPTAGLQVFDVQGAGHTSPYDGVLVTGVPGVVTAVRAGGALNGGFWMSAPEPDADDATSDGIFIFTGTNPAAQPGDLVLVDGGATEFRPFFEDLAITRITQATFTVDSSGHELPTTVVGIDRTPPSLVIDDDSAGTVETSRTFDPEEDGIDFWETLEGMRLAVSDAVAVGPTNDFGEIAVVSQDQADAGVRTPRGGVLVRDLSTTGNYQPGDFNPERLLLDDLLIFPAPMPQLNVGDEFVADPVGVLDQSFGAFKLLVTQDPGRVDNMLQREAASPAGPMDLAVATFNVENLSARDCVNEPAKVAGLADQIVTSLRSPDLIAIEEMQDNSGDTDDTPDGDDGVVVSDQSWQCLIDAIVAAGGPLYDFRQIDPTNNADGGVPGGNIRVGFLFHSERGLEFVDRPGGDALTDTDVVSTANGKGARLTVSPGRILDTPAGMETAWFETRKSLAGEFTFRGETVFVVANHFSSKGDDNPLYSTFQPPARFTEFQSGGAAEDGWRHAQAQSINDFVDEILAVDAGAHVIVLGDINDFDFSETVQVLTGERIAAIGGRDADGSGPTAPGGDAVLRTLFDTLAANERYSYVFEGNSQVLDQILVSESLFDLGATYDVVHVNAEFADQVSDHDPSVMRVAFQPRRR
jgi:predicted extracellular nuclease